MTLRDDVLTKDNALHSALTVIVVGTTSIVSGAWYPLIAAGLMGLLLYLREASQVEWDFTLRWSFHKHMEWFIGAVAGFAAAGVAMLIKAVVS